MKVLVINAGSSSLKYQLIDMDNEGVLCKGLVDRIGFKGSSLEHKVNGKVLSVKQDMKNHTDAFKLVLKALIDKEYGVVSDISEIGAVGHRVLHSGEDFKESVLITDEVIKICKKNAVLGPLHMPANIACIESCLEVMPKGTPMTAVFDTVFHSTMPDYAYMYGIPYADYKQYKIRKYGFHGTSHKYISGEAVKLLAEKGSKVVTCHLGNGSSISAVVDGKCIDTSMGLTPLEGVIMGTRSGDLDPAVVEFMAEQKGISVKEVLRILNKESGFLGIAGVSDCRDLTAKAENGDYLAQLALNMFCYRVKKYIGSYVAAMGGLDMVVFSGGIGENSAYCRENILKGLECFGIEFDTEKNNNAPRGSFAELNTVSSKVKVAVIPTNEELVIAREALAIANKSK